METKLENAQYWANVRANWFAGVRGMREHRAAGNVREFMKAYRLAACARMCFAAMGSPLPVSEGD